MANLDKLLKKIEHNIETENEVSTHELKIAGETFQVKTMTRREKRDFIYAQETNKNNFTVGEIVKKMKPFVYRALDLAPLAVKAKDAGYIKSNYDVVETLFEPEQIITILDFIMEINKISISDLSEEVDEIKK